MIRPRLGTGHVNAVYMTNRTAAFSEAAVSISLQHALGPLYWVMGTILYRSML